MLLCDTCLCDIWTASSHPSPPSQLGLGNMSLMYPSAPHPIPGIHTTPPLPFPILDPDSVTPPGHTKKTPAVLHHHGSRAHWCKHGTVLLHRHAGRWHGFAHSSSVAVGPCGQLLKRIAPPSSAHFPLFVFWIWDVSQVKKTLSSKLDGPASKRSGEIWSDWNQRVQGIVVQNWLLWHSGWKETVGQNDVQANIENANHNTQANRGSRKTARRFRVK